MCGILCVLGVDKGAEHVRPLVLERARRLRHRGPDWSGVHCKGKNILAHERLSIVDVESGSQPLYNKARTLVLAVNGEIYNHAKIATELKDPSEFMTKSDCEIILHLWEEHGLEDITAGLNRMNGIFGFVLVDESTGTFIAARDHEGIIPLYLGKDADGNTWIASELKALHDVCETFEDFPPGHYYVQKQGQKGSYTKWYDPVWHDPSLCTNNRVNLTELREKFEAAVVRQLMCDVPYGVLLSGGLDSSLVSAIASRHAANRVEEGEKTKAHWPRLHSFSIGLKESPDLKAARVVAKAIDSVHHEFVFTVDEGLNAVRDVIYHLETYDVTTVRAATPMYLMARKIKALGVKMVLSGEGADEMFGGYLYFYKCPSKEEFQKESVNKVKGLYKFDCLRANKSLCAWGVEGRVPFLDKEFMDYAMAIAPEDKMCGRNGLQEDGKPRIEKYILRKAFQGYIPDEILWRQKEQFSDGVGYSWIDSLKANAAAKISDQDFKNAEFKFPHNTPPTKEAYYVRMIFEEHFPGRSARMCVPGGPSVACSTAAAILWDESFKTLADCSGRSVAGVHEKAYNEKERKAAQAAVNDDDVKKADLSFASLSEHKRKAPADSKNGHGSPAPANGSAKKAKK